MKKTKGIIFTALTSLMLVFVMSVTVLAASITPAQAESKALSDAGFSSSEITGLRTELDDGNYEVEFMNGDRTAKYEYEISARNGRINDISVDYRYEKNYSKAKISKNKAYKIVSKASGKKLKTVKSGTIKKKLDDGEWIYKIRFTSGSYRYEYEVHAVTGKITEFDKEYKGKW